MKKRTNIAAFTLSELVVVMVLTAIVAGLAFLALRIVQQHMRAISENYKTTTAIHKLEQALWIDMHTRENANYNELENQLKFDSITYIVSPPYIIREKDTITKELNELSLLFNGNILNKELVSNFDAIKLVLGTAKKQQTIFVFRSNSAADFMNE